MKINNPCRFNKLFENIPPKIITDYWVSYTPTAIYFETNDTHSGIIVDINNKSESIQKLLEIENNPKFKKWITKIE